MSAPASPDTPAGAAAVLRSTQAVRSRARVLLERARAGRSQHFEVNDQAMTRAATLTAEITRRRYPSLKIPYHSRWRHFEAGGIQRAVQLDALLGSTDPHGRARAQIDLAVVSVLLDAGAGASWHYLEPGTGMRLGRSEGLGVASFHAFTRGLFSSDPRHPLQADAEGLRALTASALATAFQVTEHNTLVGLEGRVTLLQKLGAALAAQRHWFGTAGRPGGLFDSVPRPGPDTLHAHDLLATLLDTLSAIWAAPNAIANLPLGDCWPHPDVTGEGLTHGWMPFHKLSQWLTYSLLEPFEWAGVAVNGLDSLTGLPEYRNGGLFLDSGVLQPRSLEAASRTWSVADPFIVEWRALTVALLDELAPRVRSALGVAEHDLPLACVLEGGTWAAGRALAQELRAGLPPLQIESDGTVF